MKPNLSHPDVSAAISRELPAVLASTSRWQRFWRSLVAAWRCARLAARVAAKQQAARC